jgi:hypothetical protein
MQKLIENKTSFDIVSFEKATSSALVCQKCESEKSNNGEIRLLIIITVIMIVILWQIRRRQTITIQDQVVIFVLAFALAPAANGVSCIFNF